MSEFCKQTRSHANLHRLQFCAERDGHTVYDPVDGCLRCRRCGGQAKHCKSCSRLVHWMESPCPGWGYSTLDEGLSRRALPLVHCMQAELVESSKAISPRDPARSSPRVLILRAGAIGDTLMVTPLVRALRQTFPAAYLVFLCSRQ